MKTLFSIFALMVFCASSALAQPSFGKQVRFARGKNSATVQGTILNVNTMHTYALAAKEGQRMQIRLTTTSAKIGFVVTKGSLAEGEVLIEEGTGTQTVDLPSDGEYQISIQGMGVMGVSLIRNVRYTLKITIL